MADIPYMSSTKNLAAILDKIKGAGTPPKFTQQFLKSNLGFTGSNDRSVIRVLKGLGFLSPDGVPTPRYNEFRNSSLSGRALATGLREGWDDVFLSNQAAYTLNATDLKELFKNVSGKGESAAEKMASTFKVLADAADWSPTDETLDGTESGDDGGEELQLPSELAQQRTLALHHDVHVHLPATSDVAVYTAIFRALRQELID